MFLSIWGKCPESNRWRILEKVPNSKELIMTKGKQVYAASLPIYSIERVIRDVNASKRAGLLLSGDTVPTKVAAKNGAAKNDKTTSWYAVEIETGLLYVYMLDPHWYNGTVVKSLSKNMIRFIPIKEVHDFIESQDWKHKHNEDSEIDDDGEAGIELGSEDSKDDLGSSGDEGSDMEGFLVSDDDVEFDENPDPLLAHKKKKRRLLKRPQSDSPASADTKTRPPISPREMPSTSNVRSKKRKTPSPSAASSSSSSSPSFSYSEEDVAHVRKHISKTTASPKKKTKVSTSVAKANPIAEKKKIVHPSSSEDEEELPVVKPKPVEKKKIVQPPSSSEEEEEEEEEELPAVKSKPARAMSGRTGNSANGAKISGTLQQALGDIVNGAAPLRVETKQPSSSEEDDESEEEEEEELPVVKAKPVETKQPSSSEEDEESAEEEEMEEPVKKAPVVETKPAEKPKIQSSSSEEESEEEEEEEEEAVDKKSSPEPANLAIIEDAKSTSSEDLLVPGKKHVDVIERTPTPTFDSDDDEPMTPQCDKMTVAPSPASVRAGTPPALPTKASRRLDFSSEEDEEEEGAKTDENVKQVMAVA